MARLLWFSAYQCELYAALRRSSDGCSPGSPGKALKEVAYHLDHATQWVVRLGDGTEESHRRMQEGLEGAAPYVAELFDDDDGCARSRPMPASGSLPSTLHDAVVSRVAPSSSRRP